MSKKVDEPAVDLADDLFDTAFDEALSSLETDAPATTEADKAEDVEPPVDEVPAAEGKVENEVPEKQPEVPEKQPEPVDIKAVVAEVLAATKPAEVEEKNAEPAAPQPTAEELAAEEQFKKDWPEHAAREAHMKAELAELKALLSTTAEALKGQIQPVVQAVADTTAEKHLNTILAKHADALEIYPDVAKWVETQPKILQPAFKATLEGGSASDVIELYDLYKKATPAAGVDTAAQEAKLKQQEQEKEKADRLRRMEAPTGTVRTSVTSEPDPEDFDAAFEQEAKKYRM